MSVRHVAGFLAVVSLLVAGCSRGGEPGDGVRTVEITASQFAYDPPEVRVKQGEKVRLTITSKDVTHGLAIREYNINKQIPAGQPVTVEFVADKPGKFSLFCTVFCGTGHAAHKGVLVVEP